MMNGLKGNLIALKKIDNINLTSKCSKVNKID